MRASPEGRDELSERVQRVLSLPTKKEAEHVVSAVILSLETTLLTHLDTDGFTLKLNRFGKFYVHHRPGIRRKIGFSGASGQSTRCNKSHMSVERWLLSRASTASFRPFEAPLKSLQSPRFPPITRIFELNPS